MRRQQSESFNQIPVGPLAIIPLMGCTRLGELVNSHLAERRRGYIQENANQPTFPGYLRESYIIPASIPRFATGEGKAVINQTVRGHDVFILTDISNYSITFNMYGMECPMSPDDHFQDLKRVIGAISGKAHRISVVMPLLYEGRQHKRSSRESLDCAVALQELSALGVENIITFDAHDPRVQNAIPLKGFENMHPTYQIIKALLKSENGITLEKGSTMVISPDEGAIGRSLYYSSVLGMDMGLFYKRRDYSKIVNGKNPIIKHEFLGDSIEGKDVLIVDDILASGESILGIARELKNRKARRIFITVTFALFTESLAAYDQAYRDGLITRVFSTNLAYRSEALLNSPWYTDVDVSKHIAGVIDTLNLDQSISSYIDSSDKIHKLLDSLKK